MTGVSSFTGYYIAKALVDEGCEVVGITVGSMPDTQVKVRRIRELVNLKGNLKLVPLSELDKEPKKLFDVLILHGSYMVNRRRNDFDIQQAVKLTTETTKTLVDHGSYSLVVHTGTFSEPNESLGDDLRSFDPYSTSKSLIYEAHRDLFDGSPLHKYVMPNPIGLLQNSNIFTSAFNEWKTGKVFHLNNPWLVRDFVPVELLASDYLGFIKRVMNSKTNQSVKRYPSLYVGTLGMMLAKVANIAKKSHDLACLIEASKNQNKSEQQPRIRINTDMVDSSINNWNEELWWNEYVKGMINEAVC